LIPAFVYGFFSKDAFVYKDNSEDKSVTKIRRKNETTDEHE